MTFKEIENKLRPGNLLTARRESWPAWPARSNICAVNSTNGPYLMEWSQSRPGGFEYQPTSEDLEAKAALIISTEAGENMPNVIQESTLASEKYFPQ